LFSVHGRENDDSKSFLAQKAMKSPGDWLCIQFQDPDIPLAISLEPGMAGFSEGYE
jgi:hypothetical protein